MTRSDAGTRRPPTIAQIVRIALILIPLGVIGNVIFALATTERELLAALTEFSPAYLLLALGLAVFQWLPATLRILIWTRFLGHRMSPREGFHIVLGSEMGVATSPTALGGGLIKWGLFVQRGISPGTAVSLCTLPTIEDALFVAIALPIAITLSSAWRLPLFRELEEPIRHNVPVGLAIWGLVALLAWVVVRLVLADGAPRRSRGGSRRWLERAGGALRTGWRDARDVFRLVIIRGKSLFAFSMLLTALQWTCRYSVLLALLAFFEVPVDPALFYVLQWLVFALMTLVPTPGATGGAEAAFYLIYSGYLPGDVLGLVTVGWRFLTFYLQVGLAALLFSFLTVKNSCVRSYS
jgi:glycosyltransferase 2 family protein